jgi:hypothetical protein
VVKPKKCRLGPKNGRWVNGLTGRSQFWPYGTHRRLPRYPSTTKFISETIMTWGKGILLWLVGIPLPIIILLALFWR